jgi:hypothetical protein
MTDDVLKCCELETHCHELESSLASFYHSIGKSYCNANIKRILKAKKSGLWKTSTISLREFYVNFLFP